MIEVYTVDNVGKSKKRDAAEWLHAMGSLFWESDFLWIGTRFSFKVRPIEPKVNFSMYDNGEKE